MSEMETIESSIDAEMARLRAGLWLVTLYSVTRHYGGPEEGGWYYDNYELVEEEPSKGPMRWELAADLQVDLKEAEEQARREDRRPQGRFSVLGGADRVWCLERNRGEETDLRRPRYE